MGPGVARSPGRPACLGKACARSLAVMAWGGRFPGPVGAGRSLDFQAPALYSQPSTPRTASRLPAALLGPTVSI